MEVNNTMNETTLSISSRSLQAQQAAEQQAKATARAAKLKADNAPAGH